jgi:hypothetical protein
MYSLCLPPALAGGCDANAILPCAGFSRSSPAETFRRRIKNGPAKAGFMITVLIYEPPAEAGGRQEGNSAAVYAAGKMMGICPTRL